MNPTPSDGLFCLCPQCGIPAPAGEYQCRCGCRLSPALPLYRLCPSCMRFVPQAQLKCSCGHTFPVQEQLLHTCPVCGAISPYEQRRCDCGYDFPSPPVYREEDMDKLRGDLSAVEKERSALQQRLQRVQTQNAQQWSDFFECAQLTNPYDGTKIKTLAGFERYMATHMRELAAQKAETPAEDAPTGSAGKAEPPEDVPTVSAGEAETTEDAPTVSARVPDFWDSDSLSSPGKPIGYIPVRQPQDDRPVFFDRRKKRVLPLWWIVCACLLCLILFGCMLRSAYVSPSRSGHTASGSPEPVPSPTATVKPTPPLSSTPAPSLAHRPTPMPTPEPSFFNYSDLSPIPLPQNGDILYKADFTSQFLFADYCAPLTIDASSCSESTSFYIKLKRIGTNTTYLSFFVRGGMKAEVDAPLGTYELLYASGTDWYGQEALFGATTAYYRAGDEFRFYESDGFVNGWTVTLGVIPDGNLDVHEITAGEF